jgi:TPR repeat protein
MYMKRLLPVAFVLLASHAAAYEPATYVHHAIESIKAERYGLARSYLDPLVIDPRLTSAQRAQAYYFRGYSFFAEGLYVSAAQDYARALEFAPDNTAALAAVGRLYADGLGVRKDPAEAFGLLLKAARGGQGDAKLYVGWAYLTGTGTKANVDKARFWLGEAVSDGRLEAKVQLARSYRAPYAAKPDPQKALKLYQEAAAAGSTTALIALGYMYLGTEAGAADPARAAGYFRQAAEQGTAVAQSVMGALYANGIGVPRDYAKAREWFERAIAQHLATAYTGLAHLYLSGLGVTANRQRALELFEAGASRGDVAAQLTLAGIELRQPTSQQGTADAIRWLRAAAAQNHPEGHNGLAWVLATTRYDDLRDGTTAVREARLAVAQQRNATTLDTLAAALAESGDFKQAVATQQEAIAALGDDPHKLDAEFQTRLKGYRNGVAWRE